MKEKNLLLTVAVVLIGFSLIDMWWEILSNRWLRLFTSGIFLFEAIRILGFKKLLGLSIFGLLILCDIFMLDWETTLAKYAYYSLHSLIMLFLLYLSTGKLEWQKITLFEILPAILFLLINSWILWTLRGYFRTDDILLEILFLFNGFFTALLVVIAFVMSINRPNDSSAYFLWGILSLVVSELILFAVFYIGMEPLRYVDNIFYIISLFFLLRASLENKLINETNALAEENEEERNELTDSETLKTYR